MTRQEELVWAAAWALSLRDTRGADDPYRATIAKERAHEAVDELRTEADLDSIQGSDAEADVLLRQMAGEPDCFMPRRPLPEGSFPGVYLMCQHPQVERCAACRVFDGGARKLTIAAMPPGDLAIWAAAYVAHLLHPNTAASGAVGHAVSFARKAVEGARAYAEREEGDGDDWEMLRAVLGEGA
jgi:hypothetical protein